MSLPLLETYEKIAYDIIIEWYNETNQPMIAKQVFEKMEDTGYPKSSRTFKGILSSLREQQLIEGKMVRSGTYKGKMGYVPSARASLTTQTEKEPTPKEIPKWKIELLTKILKDDKLPETVKESAAYRLRDCCGYNTSIDPAGEEILQEFFSNLLERPQEEDKTYIQLLVGFEEFIRFHMSDKVKWILNNYYEMLLNLFRTGKYDALRRKALRCLGQIFYLCKENKSAKTKELCELFMNVFFDPREGEKVAEVAFENMRIWSDEMTIQDFVKKLYENMETGNETIKNRCLRYLERKILPIV